MTSFAWNQTGLDSAIGAAFRPSVYAARDDAARRSHSPAKAGATVRDVQAAGTSGRAELAPTGLGSIFEHGRKPGYQIQPRKGTVLAFRSGIFAAHATGGPMQAFPYLHPAAIAWARGGYQSAARISLASRGF